MSMLILKTKIIYNIHILYFYFQPINKSYKKSEKKQNMRNDYIVQNFQKKLKMDLKLQLINLLKFNGGWKYSKEKRL